jgi:citrate synthase
MQMQPPPISAGLDNVVVAETRLSEVDGLAGRLTIAGFAVEELAPRATFEELVYLLWNDHLPNLVELRQFTAALAANRTLAPATLALLSAAAQTGTQPMDALRMACGTIGIDDPHAAPAGDPLLDALRLVAQLPTIVASYARLQAGAQPLEPRPELGHASSYLYMLTGEEPAPERVRALETYLNTVADHSLNASTFAARVIIATGSDLISAVTGALGALKGPLHGGAPGPALDMVLEIGSVERAEPYLRAKLERGERLMGFGHRVYKVRDPRADVLDAASTLLFESAGDGDRALYDLAREVEALALQLLEEYKPGRNLRTNVEFYTALLLEGLELPVALFTPTFAVSRATGWIAHCFEQMEVGRIIRPQSHYTGPRERVWTPVAER